MEQAYRLALEIILSKVNGDGYVSAEDVKMICEKALTLEESETSEC